jgi:hypothetical protein
MSMKSSLFSKIMTLATATLLVAGAYAANPVHKGSLQIVDPVQLNGTQLAPGNYTVTWQGEGPNVDLRVSRGNKEVATAQAKLVQLDKKADQDAAEVNSAGGTRELTAMRFAGSKVELEIVGAGSAQGGEGAK